MQQSMAQENVAELLIKRPIFFKRNRVWRVYKGGKLFSSFFGDVSEDGFYPEEWICSSIRALNKDRAEQNEGISLTQNDGIPLDELIARFPQEMMGGKVDLGFLVKLIDSAIRLPVQAHPDSAFSQKYFSSNYGKTESWVILDTRENACIYLGFKEKISKEDFRAKALASETDRDALPSLLNRIPVKKGDVFLINSKMIHAIGAGCLILETQEPTDFTIQPEAFCGDYRLSEEMMYLGLGLDIALDCIDYDMYGAKGVSVSRPYSHVISRDRGTVRESLISYKDTPCFAVEKLTINSGCADKLRGPAIYVVTDGTGKVATENYAKTITKGSYFFAPNAIDQKFEISSEKQIEIIICYPPVKGKIV